MTQNQNPTPKTYNLWSLLIIPFKSSPISSAIVVILTIIGAIIPSLQIIATATFIDAALAVARKSESITTIYAPLLWVVAFVAFTWTSEQCLFFAKTKQRIGIKENYRPQLIHKRASLSYHHVENQATWDLVKRVTDDAEEKVIQGFNTLLTAMGLILRVLGIAIIITTHVWWATLIMAVIAIPLFHVSTKAGRAKYRVTQETEKHRRKYHYLSDTLRSRETTEERTLFGYGKMLNKAYEAQFDMAYKSWYKTNWRWFVRMKMGSVINSFIALFIVGMLIQPTLSGAMSIGLFMSLVNEVFGLVLILNWQLPHTADEIAKKKEYLKDLTAFMALESVPLSLEPPCQDKKQLQSIALRNVSFHYPGTKKQILNKVTLTLEGGKHYAFVGANGAGKTTIVKLLLGLYPQYEGEILLNGKELRTYKQDDLIAHYAVLFQDFSKYAMSVEDNIYVGNVNDRETKSIDQALEVTGLKDTVDNLPKGKKTHLGKIEKEGLDLSGGQWQRLAMARTYNNPAPCRILDEPTASLDPLSESRLYEEFDRISRGKTTLLISHRLGSTKLADKIFVMDEGCIKEEGTHDQLMGLKSSYYEMYESQRGWYQ